MTAAPTGAGAASAPVDASAETIAHERALTVRILAFIADSSRDDFDDLALAIHDYQYRANAPYGRFVDRLGGARPTRWQDIPAVPAAAFRESVLSCRPAERVYESSGTTRGPARRARHHVAPLELYHAAALTAFHRSVIPPAARLPFVVAAPERGSHPASSLGEMVTWLREAHDRGDLPGFLGAAGLDIDGLAAALTALDPTRPVLVLAVTAALLHVTDRHPCLPLPAGSIVVDTGGCKGYERNLARSEILHRYAEAFAIAPEQVVNEYGMTELCSQLYARGHGALVAPPWVRTLVWDPATGREAAAGEPGLLRHFDVANLGSVLGVQTDDVGRVVPGGLELLGRASGADSRGCSLLVQT